MSAHARNALLSLLGFAALACDPAPGQTTDAAVPVDAPVLDAGPRPDRAASVTVAGATTIAETDPRFLSFAIDTALVVGGTFWSPDGSVKPGGTGRTRVDPFDWSDATYRALAGHLAPAYLRVGGSDADRAYVDLSDTPVTEAPAGYEWVLTRAMWDGMHDFASALGLDVVFTLNAGPGSRGADFTWDDTQARALMEHAAAEGQEVAVWELGNEPNAFLIVHGLEFNPPVPTLVEAYRDLVALRDALTPSARIAGPTAAWWPRSGELAPMYETFMSTGGAESLDIVSWHYYPQQSRRCAAAVVRATPTLLLDRESALEEADRWAAEVEASRDAHAPGRPIWLGETGHAQCGGEPGVSSTFVSSFWWLDELGRLARRGHAAVVRQQLTGSDYALLDFETQEPRPDYWASVLWKQLMGTRVLALSVADAEGGLHCRRSGADGEIMLLLINLTRDQAVDVDLGDAASAGHEAWLLTAPELLASEMELNGTVLSLGSDLSLPSLEGRASSERTLHMPAASIAFVALDAGATACAP